MSNNEPIPMEIGAAVEELKGAAAFLTCVPPRFIQFDRTRAPTFRTGARVFPVVGALIGLAGGIVLVVAMWIGIPALLSAALAIGATVAVTGALHEDGLADSADSLGGTTAAQRLEIMRDSRIGAYGTLALIFSAGVRVLALGSVVAAGSFRAAVVLIAAEAVGRAALVRVWHDLPAARADSMSEETGPPDQQASLIALAIAAVIALVCGIPTVGLLPTVFGGALAALGTYVVMRFAANLIGGRTGDTLGAGEQVAVIAFLVGATAF